MKSYIEIEGVRVDTKILTAKFSCDYEKCGGACCNKPVPGVPLNGGALSDYEAAEILLHRKALSFFCDKGDQKLAEEQPVSKEGEAFYTTLSGHKCVFCNMQKGICALKIAKEKRAADIDIPFRCQLYPLVLKDFDDYESLEVESIFDEDYCVHGYAKGKRDNVFLLDFMKAPLVRGFGEVFFQKLKEAQEEYL